MCGIFGTFNCPKAAEMVFLGLHGNQHRAQEFAGIVSSDGANLFRETGSGIVQDVFNQERLDQLHGQAAIGHVRYSTVDDNPKQDNTQPIIASFCNYEVALAHNGNLPNACEQKGRLCPECHFKTGLDSELILRLFCESRADSIVGRVFEAVRQVRGTYSLLLLYSDAMIAVRDPWGNRPLVLGKRNGSYFVSSETIAFDLLGIEFIREIAPGEICIITKKGCQSFYFDENRLDTKPVPHRLAFCIFELLYFSHPGSYEFGQQVTDFRLRAGQELASQCPSPAKRVLGIPDSSLFHADGYASGSPDAILVRALLRSHYIARTFIDAWAATRVSKAAKKFMPIRYLIEGNDLTVIDDSIVRLTTLPEVIRLLRQVGAQKIHVRITTPPIKHPCFFGIDTPTKEELIAASATMEEIKTRSGADSLEFMPIESLKGLVPNPDDFCFTCMTGDSLISL